MSAGLYLNNKLTVDKGAVLAARGEHECEYAYGVYLMSPVASQPLYCGGEVYAVGAVRALSAAPTLRAGLTAGYSRSVSREIATVWDSTKEPASVLGGASSAALSVGISPKAYDCFVGGVRVTEENKSDVLGDGTVTYVPKAAAEDGGTLILNGLKLTEVDDGWPFYSELNIYDTIVPRMCGIASLYPLTIQANGSNRIRLSGEKWAGVHILRDTVIGGSGSLEIDMRNSSYHSAYLESQGDYSDTIDNCALNISTGLTVQDSVSLTAYGGESVNSFGARVTSAVTLKDTCRVSLTGGRGIVRSMGLYQKGGSSGLRMEGGRLEAFSGVVTGAANYTGSTFSYGVSVQGTAGIYMKSGAVLRGESRVSDKFSCGVYVTERVYVAEGATLTATGKNSTDAVCTIRGLYANKLEVYGTVTATVSDAYGSPVSGSTVDVVHIREQGTVDDGTLNATTAVTGALAISGPLALKNKATLNVSAKTAFDTAPDLSAHLYTTGTVCFISGGEQAYAANIDLLKCREAHLSSGAVRITFDKNNGWDEPEAVYIRKGGQLESLPTPTRTGWRFLGWYTARTGGRQVDLSTTYSADTALFAQWALVYDVVFYPENGWNPTGRQVCNGDPIGELPIPEPYEHHVFVGWYTERSGGKKVEADYIVREGLTLYAHWERDEFTVHFDGNGGSVPISSLEIKIGTPVGYLPVPKNGAIPFLGWYTEAVGGEKVTESMVVTKDCVLYAHWAGGGDGILGDVDRNGKVNTTDARLTLQIAAKKITGEGYNVPAGDVDGVPGISTTDARLILQYAAGKRETL